MCASCSCSWVLKWGGRVRVVVSMFEPQCVGEAVGVVFSALTGRVFIDWVIELSGLLVLGIGGCRRWCSDMQDVGSMGGFCLGMVLAWEAVAGALTFWRRCGLNLGILDHNYEHLTSLQNEANPQFVNDVLSMFYHDAPEHIARITALLSSDILGHRVGGFVSSGYACL
ncbi:hypothetical protein F3Y22_tig00110946pilonHSYRG00033 [Hibiscus syriacus]|uniref:Uncharacterized protein n=1 Tax=Hibiscus syriacus TaxID=106335 RepID=A0A6A2ZD12_HIBSY|nr:hypothetical protein F3Y22_tig00110946pilonHSYRG00033 [Hibiscus syriacus]